jgi:hypothetical protein
MNDFEIVLFVCFFTFLINLTESLAYCMRYAGLKTKQISIAMSFVTSTLLISRLSNMFQAPLLGKMVDETIMLGTQESISLLENRFRFIIFAGSLGVLFAGLLSPTFVKIFQLSINNFLKVGSIPKMFFMTIFSPRRIFKIISCFRIPSLKILKGVSLQNIPKTFLILNGFVSAIYAIGVLASLLAGSNLPHLRATAIQLSGIVNGIATILFTLLVDPSGARITDQAVHANRPFSDVKSVVFFMLLSRMIGILIISQIILLPATKYIITITKLI